MKARGMIFNAEMVNALLDGRKTQTRRPLGLPKNCIWLNESDGTWTDLNLDHGFWHAEELPAPHGEVGDLIYVRETFRIYCKYDECGCSESPCGCPKTGTPLYRVTHDTGEDKWTPSIHMPRWASRLTLEITDVRVEHVQDISEEDAAAEGVKRGHSGSEWGEEALLEDFECLWDSIYQNWNENPWVWVYSFKVHHINVDQFIKEAA